MLYPLYGLVERLLVVVINNAWIGRKASYLAVDLSIKTNIPPPHIKVQLLLLIHKAPMSIFALARLKKISTYLTTMLAQFQNNFKYNRSC